MEEKFNIKAVRKDFNIDIRVRKMGIEEMPNDGLVYYCEEGGQIYEENELNFINN